jgi:hypothetical protein
MAPGPRREAHLADQLGPDSQPRRSKGWWTSVASMGWTLVGIAARGAS